METIRVDINGLFICEECEYLSKSRLALFSHIVKKHIKKKYYDKWLKEKNEGICKICGNKTSFLGRWQGYGKCCSSKCYNLDRYGVEHYWQTNEFKEKRKKTLIAKYGIAEPLQSKKFLEKRKKTNFKKYGFETAKLNKRVNEKYKNTCLERYGVENAMHHPPSFEKMQKSSRIKKPYKNTSIWYQGTYELDFLEKYYDKFTDMERAPSIKYQFDGKNKIYYPDFFIPSLNLIIEIKSSYYFTKNRIIDEIKEKYTKINGFNYLRILDKNYADFENPLF